MTICTDPEEIRYLRVAVHFFLPQQYISEQILDDKCSPGVTDPFLYIGSGNFTETSDGFGNNNYNGYQRAEEIIEEANYELANNSDQWRKEPGVSYPSTPPQVNIRYILSGVYFHRDEDVYYRVQSSSTANSSGIHAQYDVGGNSVIDVYHLPKLYADGAAPVGSADKFILIKDYHFYIQPNCRTWSLEAGAKALNHEIGHSLSLNHTWIGNDFCDDTPLGFIYDRVTGNPAPNDCQMNQRANCWGLDPNIPGCPRKPCDEIHKISNNVMDYNSYFPRALTQCQIGRMNANLAGNGNTYIHSCNGCMPSQAFFQINKSYQICGSSVSVVLNGQASFNETTWLIEICEILPNQPGNCISGTYYTTGWKAGTIGRVELAAFYNFLPDKSYKIKLTVDNAECPPSHTYEQVISTKGCPIPEPCGCFELLPVNPFEDLFSLYYEATEPGLLEVVLVHQVTNQTTQLIAPTQISPGSYIHQQNVGHLPTGSYAVVALFRGEQYAKSAIRF